MRYTLKVVLVTVLVSAFMIAGCFADDPEDVVAPVLSLSNMGSGEWIIANEDELSDVLLIETEDFDLGDVDESSERLYMFKFIGQTPGWECVNLYYYRENELIICMELEIDVDANLNVRITEASTLSGVFADYFSGDERDE